MREREREPGKYTEATSCSVEVLEVSRRVLELEVEQDSLEREDSPDPDAGDDGDVDSDAG